MGFLRNISTKINKLNARFRLATGTISKETASIDIKIPQPILDKALLITYKKYAPVVEDILRDRIVEDIESVTVANAGGPWYPDGSPYVKRNVLSGSVISKVTLKEGIRVSATASSAPSILHGGRMEGIGGGWGAYLEFHEVGNWGFMRYKGFPRPAVTNAQAEANALQPIIEREALELAIQMW